MEQDSGCLSDSHGQELGSVGSSLYQERGRNCARNER